MWTAKQAGELVLGTAESKLGAGALISAMVRRGVVARIEEGKYVVVEPGVNAAPVHVEQAPLPALSVVPPIDTPITLPAPIVAPAAQMQVEPVFLEVGTYVFSPGTFAIERDDRGGAVVTLLVAETDMRTGKALPREIELTPEEWASRRRITLTDVVDGNASAELFERIGVLEREAAHWRKEHDAAWALAQDYERQLNEYRQWEWAIKIAQQGKAA